MELFICKADATADQEAPSSTIHICDPLPAFKDLDHAAIFYDAMASQIEETLYYSLPGGAYDRLLGRMLKRKATHFRVAHGQSEDNT